MVSERGPYAVSYYKRFEKDLRRLPVDDQRRVVKAIDALKNNPRPPGVKKLSGQENFWRIRVGDYRVIYAIEDQMLRVFVVRLAPRGDAYRGLD